MITALNNGLLMHDTRGAAAQYLELGVVPIPLPPQSKVPQIAGWQNLRPTPEDLDRLFPAGQALNIGVLLGEPSHGLVDVDLDTLEALAAAPLLLPPTGWLSGREGKPRSHWWYRVRNPPNKASEKFSDIDADQTCLLELRSTGGQTVVPPSIHESGEPISWHTFTTPAEVELGELLTAVRAVAAVALLARHWPGKGSRQDAFLALAGALLRAGWVQGRTERLVEALAVTTNDEEPAKRIQAVAATLHKQAQHSHTTGWPKLEELIGPTGKEVVRRVRQWLGMMPKNAPSVRANKRVRTLEPYQPFPIDALPAPLGEFVRQGALALGCDPSFLALPVLAVVASVIGNTRVLQLKRTWQEPSVVWAAIVGDSGSLKSPAYKMAVKYLFKLQSRMLLEHKAKMGEYREKLEEYKAAKQKAKQEGANAPRPPEEPLRQRIVCSDATIEKLAEILDDNPRGTLLAREELAGWLGSFTRYKKAGGGSDLPSWLEFFQAGNVTIDRKTTDRKTIFIKRAAVSITGGIQPGVLARALTPELLDAGLPPRLLVAMPTKRPKRWSEAEIAPEVEHAYHSVLDRLLALDFDTTHGEKEPHVLRLSDDAKKVWVAFYNAWGQEQAAVCGELAAAYSKLEGYAARFALLHHVVSQAARGLDDLVLVKKESVEAGVKLCHWFAREFRRIYSTLSESNDERETRRLVEFIQARGGRITVRGLMQGNCRRYPNAEAAESALAFLVEAELARWVELPPKSKGKPVRAVELCMTHDTDGDDGDDDGLPVHDTPHDTDPDTGPGAQHLRSPETDCDGLRSAEDKGVMRVMRHAQDQDTEQQDGEGTAQCHTSGVAPDDAAMPAPSILTSSGAPTPAYRVVQDQAGLDVVAVALANTQLVGLDLETTGLDPRSDRVRLLSLAINNGDGKTASYLVDCFAVDPPPLWKVLAGKDLILHNAAFDLAFLARLGFTPSAKVHDTMLLAQLLTAGTNVRVTLSDCCQRWLHRPLNKAQQKSDWSGDLTNDQLAYAALDVEVLAPLLEALTAKLKEAGLVGVAEVEQRCMPAIVWMARTGPRLDQDAWQSLARAAGDEADRLREELQKAVPPRPHSGQRADPWNWSSPQQVKEALALAGCQVANTQAETLAATDHPLAQLLLRLRTASKRATTYGTRWLEHVADDGRVYTDWRQIGCITGRMSSSQPNLQQIPRATAYRQCFRPREGCVLVKADYSQIELRIAAKISGDQAMIDAYLRGEDLHTLTAQRLTGKQVVSKQERQLAKPVNFGLIYGMSIEGLRATARTDYGLDLSQEDASRYRQAFFEAYPGVKKWHDSIRWNKATETRTLTGRRVLVEAEGFFGAKANYQIQGTGGDGIKLALALLWERRDQAPGAFPVMAIHDEIVVECDADQADRVRVWLETAMVEAMAPLLDPVPVVVGSAAARTWGGE
jgi:DNA polymerase-1